MTCKTAGGQDLDVIVVYDSASSATLVELNHEHLDHFDEPHFTEPMTLNTIRGAGDVYKKYPLAQLQIVNKSQLCDDKITIFEAICQPFPKPHVTDCPMEILQHFKSSKELTAYQV